MNFQAQVDGTLHPGACQNLRGVTYLDNAIMNDQQGDQGGERCERVENIERAREIARCGHSTGPILAWRQLRGPVVPVCFAQTVRQSTVSFPVFPLTGGTVDDLKLQGSEQNLKLEA